MEKLKSSFRERQKHRKSKGTLRRLEETCAKIPRRRSGKKGWKTSLSNSYEKGVIANGCPPTTVTKISKDQLKKKRSGNHRLHGSRGVKTEPKESQTQRKKYSLHLTSRARGTGGENQYRTAKSTKKANPVANYIIKGGNTKIRVPTSLFSSKGMFSNLFGKKKGKKNLRRHIKKIKIRRKLIIDHIDTTRTLCKPK